MTQAVIPNQSKAMDEGISREIIANRLAGEGCYELARAYFKLAAMFFAVAGDNAACASCHVKSDEMALMTMK